MTDYEDHTDHTDHVDYEGRNDAMQDALMDDLVWWHMEQMQYDWEMSIHNGGYEQ